MTKRTILLIEDEEAISEPLAAALGREGFDPVVAATAAEGMELFERRSPDLVLLDVMLPDGDGRDLLRRIRETSRTPVVMLTARGEETDRVLGLELGADDYVTKPFSMRELIARVRAVLRRAGVKEEASPPFLLSVGPVEMDVAYDAVAADEVTEVKASVSVRSSGGLFGRMLQSATDALLAGGALNVAVQGVVREVERAAA
ncbi:MAG: response regulator transcription factor [Gaiellaceae bacterium]